MTNNNLEADTEKLMKEMKASIQVNSSKNIFKTEFEQDMKEISKLSTNSSVPVVPIYKNTNVPFKPKKYPADYSFRSNPMGFQQFINEQIEHYPMGILEQKIDSYSPEYIENFILESNEKLLNKSVDKIIKEITQVRTPKEYFQYIEQNFTLDVPIEIKYKILIKDYLNYPHINIEDKFTIDLFQILLEKKCDEAIFLMINNKKVYDIFETNNTHILIKIAINYPEIFKTIIKQTIIFPVGFFTCLVRDGFHIKNTNLLEIFIKNNDIENIRLLSEIYDKNIINKNKFNYSDIKIEDLY